MAILNITQTLATQVGTSGMTQQQTYIVSNDTLAEISTIGYLNDARRQGYTFGPLDTLYVTYPKPATTPLQWIMQLCSLDLNNNEIVIVPDVSEGNVIGPVIPGDIAIFANISGAITDGGPIGTAASKNASNNLDATVASVGGATVVGNLAAFSDANGTIVDSGVTPSDNSNARVASVFSSTVVGNIPTFTDLLGTIADSGAALSSSQAHVAAVSGATVIGNLPVFSDVTGTIVDSGISPSASTFTWSGVVGTTQALAAAKGYWTENAALTTFTLPATIAAGDVFGVSGVSAGGWTIAQGAGQQIRFGVDQTTVGVGGSLSSTAQGNCIYVLCDTANTHFTVLNSQGNLTVV